MNRNEPAKVGVYITMPKKELEEMRRAVRVDSAAPAVLSMARKGLAAEKEQDKPKR